MLGLVAKKFGKSVYLDRPVYRSKRKAVLIGLSVHNKR
jgi:hypothetical protein